MLASRLFIVRTNVPLPLTAFIPTAARLFSFRISRRRTIPRDIYISFMWYILLPFFPCYSPQFIVTLTILHHDMCAYVSILSLSEAR